MQSLKTQDVASFGLNKSPSIEFVHQLPNRVIDSVMLPSQHISWDRTQDGDPKILTERVRSLLDRILESHSSQIYGLGRRNERVQTQLNQTAQQLAEAKFQHSEAASLLANERADHDKTKESLRQEFESHAEAEAALTEYRENAPYNMALAPIQEDESQETRLREEVDRKDRIITELHEQSMKESGELQDRILKMQHEHEAFLAEHANGGAGNGSEEAADVNPRGKKRRRKA